ncbi:hypothetical protein BN159_0518 [Streptomyces davaonensis JCM 4913]|uniref:Sporulation and cell division protein SsgA n=1 Tax=Streptomyces davaonensis (strain DSM 101723 / JCM 4913 / KCC S-0913 / 768) TaxID=1214101 RepID=K4QVE5_STRDJ|nr:SsgA family sporulation/cell division regulator [Streptomyces davaonensis]CCK24897.1 hypothetical protein BN159_0518 [Streptomyces davaonensis JCM 4913]
MYVTLEVSTGAQLLTPGGSRPIPVTLRYTSSDPLAVHLGFPSHVTLDGKAATWAFARELLTEGLVRATGAGSVCVRPEGSFHTVVELSAPQGMARLRFATEVLRRFLTRAHSVVAPGEEAVDVELDHDLMALFGDRT